MSVILLSTKDYKIIREDQKNFFKQITIVKNKNAEIIYDAKSIRFLDKVIKEFNNGIYKIKNKNIKVNNIPDLYKLQILSKWDIQENGEGYSGLVSFITSNNRPILELENRFSKNVFGFDNSLLYSFYNIGREVFVSFLFIIPIYININIDKNQNLLVSKHSDLHTTVFLENIEKKIYRQITPFQKQIVKDRFEELLFNLNHLSLSSKDKFTVYVDVENYERIKIFHYKPPISEDSFALPLNATLECEKLLSGLSILYNNSNNSYYVEDSFKNKIQISPLKSDLISTQFSNLFYTNLKNQINLSWKLGLFLSSLILSRKIVECLLIDILIKKYPRHQGINNAQIYTDIKTGHYRNFVDILEELKNRKKDFVPLDKDITKLLSLIRPFRGRANTATHSLTEKPSQHDIETHKIQEIVELANNIYTSI